MKRSYNLFQQYIAYVLLISLFLQGCNRLNSPLLPIQEEEIASIQTYTQQQLTPQLQANIQPLVDQTVTAEGGHAVTFYEYKGELQASVEPLDEKHSVYNGLPVEIKDETDLASLPHLPKKIQQNRILIQLAQGKQPFKEGGRASGRNGRRRRGSSRR
ncbi:hypothetical protein Aasi_1219 [Candidatus Amoebophilus asiaticus 5a2]|uniref:Uncharacterized protein n=1 Tax=Amoebophilus asiaticus (strain 5a2) TaxID=452471 RepID=B3ETJ4_AMOA5|nr:hypothetical protein [Candidatus Amoebophilus asiaticus]ACE06546.1 hypothetical protein Aasi_1219 [Candidatus Amoebophilus asiaticus 5a2]